MGHSQSTYKDKLLALNVLLCKKENARGGADGKR